MAGRTFLYGDPSTGALATGAKPPCWGTSKYDNEDRECRNCGFQNTCREQTIKSKTAVAPVVPTVSNYYSQFQPTGSYAAPQAIVQVPVQKAPIPQAPPAPQVVPIQTQPAPPVQQAQPVIQDKYGQFSDPMFTTLKSSPSVMRPQLPGESFHQRILKNMALASVESALGEVLLGVRQFLWTPSREDDKDKKR